MKKLLCIAVIAAMAPAAYAQSAYRSSYNNNPYSQPARSSYSSSYSQPVQVSGYTRNDGSYVQPHYRTAPDETRTNNYSSQGNVNPYTGRQGTRSAYGN